MTNKEMTNEEAIEILKEGPPFTAIYSKEYEAAISHVIKALEERPQGDLISREALKNAIEEVRYNYDGYEPCDLGRFMTKVDELIDNASPVEPELSDEQIEKIADLLEIEWGYEGIREDVSRILKEERTEGEWLYGEDNGQDGWFCSKCEFFVPWYYQYYENDVDFIRDYKACPHCLAKMVTYTGKDRDKKGSEGND